MASSLLIARRSALRTTLSRGALVALAGLVPGALALFGASCNDATSLRVIVTTDFACPPSLTTEIAITRPPAAVDAKILPRPLRTTTECRDRFVGDLVVTPPEGDRAAEVGILVTAKLSPDADCSGGDSRCIVAKRHVRFLEHVEVEVPIHLSESCAGVVCSFEQTCELGACVGSGVACGTEGCSPIGDAGSATPPDLPTVEAGSTLPDAGEISSDDAGLDGGAVRAKDGPLLGPPGAHVLGECSPIATEPLARAGGNALLRLSEMAFTRSEGEGHLLWAAHGSLLSTPTESTNTDPLLPASPGTLAPPFLAVAEGPSIVSVAASTMFGFWATAHQVQYRRLRGASYTNQLFVREDEEAFQVAIERFYVHWAVRRDATTIVRSARLADLLPEDPRVVPPLAYVETTIPGRVDRIASAGGFLFAAANDVVYRFRRGALSPTLLFTAPRRIALGPASMDGALFFALSSGRVRTFPFWMSTLAYDTTTEIGAEPAVELAVGDGRVHYVIERPALDPDATCAGDAGNPLYALVGSRHGREKLLSRAPVAGGSESSSACRLQRGNASFVVDGTPVSLVAAGIANPTLDDRGCAFFQTQGETADIGIEQQIQRISIR